ncbi:uncharacterized protein LOC133392268 [Anopheles gambiae]|uniref:uncharacterized protein LOC133392268 n=1 Tax=Anopheles gambiae TaxID=7165 RepID=UPI002AC97C68|nr:uncharacterized protein LOC133392268 [Anopheles gambiae]
MNRFLRMKKEDFFHLLSLVGPKIAKMDTDFRKAITEQERLLITLRYLATGETFTSLQYVFRVSRHSISRIVKETCACLIEALRDYVKVSCGCNQPRFSVYVFKTLSPVAGTRACQ